MIAYRVQTKPQCFSVCPPIRTNRDVTLTLKNCNKKVLISWPCRSQLKWDWAKIDILCTLTKASNLPGLCSTCTCTNNYQYMSSKIKKINASCVATISKTKGQIAWYTIGFVRLHLRGYMNMVSMKWLWNDLKCNALVMHKHLHFTRTWNPAIWLDCNIFAAQWNKF